MPHEPFFRRHVPPDLPGLLADIERQRGLVAAARANSDGAKELEAMTALGHELFMAGQESEAAPLLDEALAMAKARDDAKAEIEILLGLATARQYLSEREHAVRLFLEGVGLCEATGLREQQHFLLHHLGRCYVEQGRTGKARAAFEAALAIRKTLENPRFAASTQAALDDLAGQ